MRDRSYRPGLSALLTPWVLGTALLVTPMPASCGPDKVAQLPAAGAEPVCGPALGASHR